MPHLRPDSWMVALPTRKTITGRKRLPPAPKICFAAACSCGLRRSPMFTRFWFMMSLSAATGAVTSCIDTGLGQEGRPAGWASVARSSSARSTLLPDVSWLPVASRDSAAGAKTRAGPARPCRCPCCCVLKSSSAARGLCEHRWVCLGRELQDRDAGEGALCSTHCPRVAANGVLYMSAVNLRCRSDASVADIRCTAHAKGDSAGPVNCPTYLPGYFAGSGAHSNWKLTSAERGAPCVGSS